VNNPQKAIEHLRRLHDVEQSDNRFAKRLSRIYRDTKQLPQAIEFAREATMIDPYDLDAQKTLADLYERAGEDAALIKQQKVVATLEKWHAENRRRNNPE
jgi:tetratricopeptide (TPR) repeat protein